MSAESAGAPKVPACWSNKKRVVTFTTRLELLEIASASKAASQ